MIGILGNLLARFLRSLVLCLAEQILKVRNHFLRSFSGLVISLRPLDRLLYLMQCFVQALAFASSLSKSAYMLLIYEEREQSKNVELHFFTPFCLPT